MSVQPTYFVPRSSYYNSSSREYSVDDSISKAEYFSNAVLEDTYDQAYKSRVRDAELMRNANSTIESAMASGNDQASAGDLGVRESVWTPTRYAYSLDTQAYLGDLLSIYAGRQPSLPSRKPDGVYYRPIVPTAGLQASLPPVYRVDSRISPDDIIYEPASYSRLRDQVRDVKGKMDVEKQLLDRYLGNDPSSLRNKAVEGSVNIPDYYACGGDPRNQPVSELRRKLRRMVCAGKTTKKYNPNYYKVSE